MRIKIGKSGHGGLRFGRWPHRKLAALLPHFTSSGSLPFGLPSGPKVIFSMRSSALFKQRLAMFLQLLAALVDGDRLLERHGALFELIDDRFELGERLFEGQAGNIVRRVVQVRTSWQGAVIIRPAAPAVTSIPAAAAERVPIVLARRQRRWRSCVAPMDSGVASAVINSCGLACTGASIMSKSMSTRIPLRVPS